MQEEARRYRQKLLEMRFVEGACVAAFDHCGDGVQRDGPNVVTLAHESEVHLKLLEQFHQMVEVGRQGQV